MNIQKIIALATVASFVAIGYAEEQSDIASVTLAVQPDKGEASTIRLSVVVTGRLGEEPRPATLKAITEQPYFVRKMVPLKEGGSSGVTTEYETKMAWSGYILEVTPFEGKTMHLVFRHRDTNVEADGTKPIMPTAVEQVFDGLIENGSTVAIPGYGKMKVTIAGVK